MTGLFVCRITRADDSSTGLLPLRLLRCVASRPASSRTLGRSQSIDSDHPVVRAALDQRRSVPAGGKQPDTDRRDEPADVVRPHGSRPKGKHDGQHQEQQPEEDRRSSQPRGTNSHASPVRRHSHVLHIDEQPSLRQLGGVRVARPRGVRIPLRRRALSVPRLAWTNIAGEAGT